jgi:phage terminase large subunit-like protein
MNARIQCAPLTALAHCSDFDIDELSDADFIAAFGTDDDIFLRPEQHIPEGMWRYYGFICGRGFGKSIAIASEINRRVIIGAARAIALMAPNEDRVDEVQIAFLIETAPPWFKPIRHLGALVWPNGARAEVFTPEAPGRTRSGNFDLSWLCEIVDWQHTTRKEAFDNITTATRVRGVYPPQVIWDTTSRGKNDVILELLALNEEEPETYPIQRGTTFDNPMLPRDYLRAECRKYTGRRFGEEIKGEVYAENEGALWHQDWIDDNRRPHSPSPIALRLVSIDPAISIQETADDTGLIVGSADHVGDVYVEKDLSGHHAPEVWCELAVKECAENNAAGIVIERNRGGDVNIALIRVHAGLRGMALHMLKKEEPFPRRVAGKIFVKEMWAATSKQSRAAGPASYGKLGRVHHVGPKEHFAATELELTTWEPGTRESPNKLDAHSYLIAELAGLNDEGVAQDADAAVKTAMAANRVLAKDHIRSEYRGRSTPSRGMGV